MDQHDWLYRKTIQYASKKDPCLDWGSGTGHFSLFLQENNYKDISGCAFDEPLMLNILNEKNYCFTKIDDQKPNRLNYQNYTFSTVFFSVGVLEHVRETNGDELTCLKEINRILKKDGLFICVHFPRRFSFIEFVSNLIPGKESHQFKYTKKDISTFLLKSNFQLIELKSYGIIPRNSISGNLAFIGNFKVTRFLLNIIDSFLSYCLSAITQNYGFICRKI